MKCNGVRQVHLHYLLKLLRTYQGRTCQTLLRYELHLLCFQLLDDHLLFLPSSEVSLVCAIIHFFSHHNAHDHMTSFTDEYFCPLLFFFACFQVALALRLDGLVSNALPPVQKFYVDLIHMVV